MATETGGLFYEANTSQNLATIYQQLSSILYEKQYILKFDQLAIRHRRIAFQSGNRRELSGHNWKSCNDDCLV